MADEVLLDVEETEGLPVAGSLQLGPDIDTEVQIHDRAEQRGDRIQNDDGVGERSDGTARKRPKNEPDRAPAGAHVANVWWVIAPSSATATKP